MNTSLYQYLHSIHYTEQTCTFFLLPILFLKSNKYVLGQVFGCEWSAWGDWSECTKSCGGGNIKRMREKLPGIGSCDGAREEITICDNEVIIHFYIYLFIPGKHN